jgi:aspartate-semialdehyde dehydrogenase
VAEMLPDGYCYEEDKMRYETRTILDLPNLDVCATTVRVPVSYGHAESVYAEFDREFELEEYRELLRKSPSVVYHENDYITPVELGDSNDSHVCRLRYGVDRRSVAFWNVGHNVRLGAAVNAVRILAAMIE